jgi:signal transduction histidine kinase
LDPWQVLGAGLVGVWVGGVLVLTRLADTRVPAPLRAFALCAASWALGDLVAQVAPDLLWKQLGLALLYTGAIFVPPLWWILALRWAAERGAAPWLRPPLWTWGPFAFATLMWVVMLTNPWHGLFLEPVVGGRNLYHPLWWVMAVPSYALILAALALELQALRPPNTPRVRRQAACMIAASGGTLVANWSYVAGLTDASYATIPLLLTGGVILGVGMLREGLFGVLPVALPVITSHDPDGLLVVRPDGRLIHANPRAGAILAPLVLMAERPILPALARRLTRPDARPDPGGAAPRWESLLQPGSALYRYDGEPMRWLRTTSQPVHGSAGRLLAHCLRLHDATDEQRAEAELRRGRRLESVAELARGVAHDFHNLLAVVLGNAELLADQLEDVPEVQRKLHRILRSGRQATELADQLRLYAGAAELACTRFDLSTVVRDVLELLEPSTGEPASGGAITIRLELAQTPVTVEADATQVRQLVLNLVVNARDALREGGGVVRVATGSTWLDPARAPHLVLGSNRPAGRYGYLRVSDDGCGMDGETQERIFEPFFSTKGKQRGIGLSTVLGIARSHGALLELESCVGRGTTFCVYLPAAGGDGASAAAW